MDCNMGAQMGHQFQKDAMGMPSQQALYMDPALAAEQDAIMQMNMANGGMGGGQEWAHMMAAQQQHERMAMARQQHEMEQAFLQGQQQRAVAAGGQNMAMMPPPQQQFAGVNEAAMMQGMMAVNMGMGLNMMMAPSAFPAMQQQPLPFMQQGQTATQQVARQSATVAANTDNAWAEKLGQQEWGQDYNDVQTFNVEGEKNETVEEKTKNSEFYTFMDRIRNRELLIDEEKGELVQGPGPEKEVAEDAEYLRGLAAMEGIEMPAMAPGMANQMQQDPYTQDPDLGANEDVEQWAQEYADMQDRMEKAANSTDYPFEPNNPYMHHDSPFEEGKEMLALGNLAEAALAFEAVCRKDNDNLESWRLLGTTQAENEKDGLAILALNNARRISPRDLGVHAALSVSHTNEHNTEAAMESLKAWLLYNPQYESLSNITVEPDPDQDLEMTDAFFFADPTRFREVKTLYEAAIEMNPNDVNLFTNLGVLYNISHDYDAAAEVLRRAVDVNPQDAKLWNKLGASLANGSHAEQALEAYNRALDITPGYVRAMYNMAIAYSNLAKYSIAAKYIIRAIATQEGGTNPTGEVTEMATRAMWDLLRMTLNLLDRDDLVKLTYDRNLEPFIKEFKLEGLV